jgi:hypothetical protein
VFVAVLCSLGGWQARAQTDEIQVYDASIEAPGRFGLTWHNNFTPIGRSTPDFAGGIATNHTLNGVPELAYGVRDWLELGLYFPVYSITGKGQVLFDSTKLRALFAVPHAGERRVFYGVNFELSYNEPHWEPRRFAAEIRPIMGVRFGPVDVIVNPIFDTGFNGFDRLDFTPAGRVAYNLSDGWAVALEHYADFGEVQHFDAPSAQNQTAFAVVDYKGGIGVEFGIGHGFTAASDDLVLKLMLIRDF